MKVNLRRVLKTTSDCQVAWCSVSLCEQCPFNNINPFGESYCILSEAIGRCKEELLND